MNLLPLHGATILTLQQEYAKSERYRYLPLNIRVEFDAIKLLFLKLKRLYNTTTLILESVQRMEAVYGSEFNTQKSLYTKILSEKLEFGWEDHTNI